MQMLGAIDAHPNKKLVIMEKMRKFIGNEHAIRLKRI